MNIFICKTCVISVNFYKFIWI